MASYTRGLRPFVPESLPEFLDVELLKIQQAFDAPELPLYTVATLPAAVPQLAGRNVFCTDARNAGEGAGLGTGSTVECNGTIWKIPGIATAVAA